MILDNLLDGIGTHGIRVYGDRALIDGNRVQWTSNDGIKIEAGAVDTVLGTNHLSSFIGGSPIVNGGTTTSGIPATVGSDTIADTNSSVTVTHGLGGTPSSVTVTPQADDRIWVTTVGAVTFQVNRAGTTGALVFYWRTDL